MKKQILAALTGAVLLVAAAGCGSDNKQPSLPDKLLEPPGLPQDDSSAGKGGKKTKAAPQKGDAQSDG